MAVITLSHNSTDSLTKNFIQINGGGTVTFEAKGSSFTVYFRDTNLLNPPQKAISIPIDSKVPVTFAFINNDVIATYDVLCDTCDVLYVDAPAKIIITAGWWKSITVSLEFRNT